MPPIPTQTDALEPSWKVAPARSALPDGRFPMAPAHAGRCARRRRGGVYVVVMGVTMIVAMMGLCSMRLARLEQWRAVGRQNLSEARHLAQSGVEFALGRISLASGDWRTTYIHNVEPEPIPLGNGEVAFRLLDPLDADLADSNYDPIEILGIGRVRDATFVYSVQASPDPVTAEISIDWGTWRQSTLPTP